MWKYDSSSVVISDGILRLESMAKRNRLACARGLRVHKQLGPVVFEESLRRLGELFGKTDRFAFVLDEIPLERWLRQIALQMLAEYKTKPFIQRDQAAVERRVMKRGEAQSILRIQTLFVSTDAPRFDVTRNQQVGNGDARNAAMNAVSVENCLTKKLLAASNAYGRLGLRRTRGRRQPPARLKSNPVGLEEINFTLIVLGEQVMKQLFARWREDREIVVKFSPHQSVLLRSAFKPFDATLFLDRIERSEIAQLHCQTAGRSPHLPRNFDDDRVATVKLSERQLAIEIERNEQMLARPFYARSVGHDGSLPQMRNTEKKEIPREEVPD